MSQFSIFLVDVRLTIFLFFIFQNKSMLKNSYLEMYHCPHFVLQNMFSLLLVVTHLLYISFPYKGLFTKILGIWIQLSTKFRFSTTYLWSLVISWHQCCKKRFTRPLMQVHNISIFALWPNWFGAPIMCVHAT